MPADVHERLQSLLAVHDDNRYVPGYPCEVITRPDELLDSPHVLPAAPKDALVLLRRDFRIGIPGRRQREAVLKIMG